jgi:hypothetical protein
MKTHTLLAQVDLSQYYRLGKNDTTVASVYDKPNVLINTIVSNLMLLGGIIYFLLIFYSGFKILTQGKKGLEEIRTIMLAATAGLMVMFAAFWIVKIIATITGADIVL